MLVYQSQIYVLACGFVSSLVPDTNAALLFSALTAVIGSYSCLLRADFYGVVLT